MIRRRHLPALGAALDAPAIACAQTAITRRVQHFLTTASLIHRALEKMAADLKAATDGRVSRAVLPGGAAVGATETLDAVRTGILDGHHSPPSWFAAKDPGFVLLGDTGAAFDRVADRDRWFGEEGGATALARGLYDRFGAYYVGQSFWPGEHIPARRALRGADDLRGLKIRCPPGMIAEVLGRAGASVVNLPTPELFNALPSGVADAADFANPAFNLEAGLNRTAPFSIAANHSMPTCEMSFGKRRWDGLPAEVRQAISAHLAATSAKLRIPTKPAGASGARQPSEPGQAQHGGPVGARKRLQRTLLRAPRRRRDPAQQVDALARQAGAAWHPALGFRPLQHAAEVGPASGKARSIASSGSKAVVPVEVVRRDEGGGAADFFT